MSTRLQIILVSIIALMAGLGFVATSLVLSQSSMIVKNSTSIPETGITSHIHPSIAALLPKTSKIATTYVVSPKYIWIDAVAHPGQGNAMRQSWMVNTEMMKASLLEEKPASADFALNSIVVEPSSSFRRQFIIRTNNAWESPLTQEMQVIDSETGQLTASVSWMLDRVMVEVNGAQLTVTWHFEKPCNMQTGEGSTQADGLEVNGVVVPFVKSKDVRCWANDFSGTIEYDGFTQPSFSEEVGDKKYIYFSFPDGDSVKIDIDQLDATGVHIQKVLQ